MSSYVQRVLNPAVYHGRHKKAPFFEGWYYKIVNAAEDQRYAFIPGVYMHQSPYQTHAFIQVLNGTTRETAYHKFPLFDASDETFHTIIGDADGRSEFTLHGMKLNINNDEATIQGELTFSEMKPWPVRTFSPGFMGWYAWVPNLQTNHAVLSFDQIISGALAINGETIDFTGGRGYLEKDWGSSFPDAYIWMQCNHFDEPGTSLVVSVATVEGPLTPDIGFVVGLMIRDRLYRFATYNAGTIHKLHLTDETVEITLYNEYYDLVITAQRTEGGLLKGPEREDMAKRVDETMMATVEIELISHETQATVYKSNGRNVGLEVIGDVSRLMTVVAANGG